MIAAATRLTLTTPQYIGAGIVVVLTLLGWWRIFSKAGRPGWGIIIPLYNLYLQCKVAKRPGWWWILYFIPIVNLVIYVIVMIDIAKAYSKGTGFGIGLILLPPIFVWILGFGPARYERP